MEPITIPASVADPSTYTYEMSPTDLPIVEVEPGQRFVVETLDAYTGREVRSQDLLDPDFFRRVLPLTGPIAVRGAKPGGWVALRIETLETRGVGTLIMRSDKGLLGPLWKRDPQAFRFTIDGGYATNELLGRVAIRPMIGTVAVAPPTGPRSTKLMGENAGNMDCPEIGAGATIVLPVHVPDALLYLGDGHAVMGHGELGATGIEIGLHMRLAAGLVQGSAAVRRGCWPLLIAADGWIAAIGRGRTADAAARSAVRGLCGWLDHFECDQAKARISLQGEARICQMVNNLFTVAVGLYPHAALEERVRGWLDGRAATEARSNPRARA
jgi:amidase